MTECWTGSGWDNGNGYRFVKVAGQKLIVEGFAGCGGWSTGARIAGHAGPMVGIEWDMPACRTAVAAGHSRVRADVSTFPLEHLAGRVAGVIQSPPCPSFSTAGDQRGKLDLERLRERIAAFARGEQPPEREWADDRSKLTAEPMRWAHALRPRWIALEQVPPVLPLWQYTAEKLRELGYRVWCGILSAERYGVPQTRRRAVLVARRDGLPVGPPEPTHQPYCGEDAHPMVGTLFGPVLPAPVGLADALNTSLHAAFDERWSVWPAGLTGSYNYSRSCMSPSPTIKGSGRQYVTEPRITRALTVAESGVLQSFPVSYPWQGTAEQQYRQCGDAVPPLLAAAILRPLIQDNPKEAAA